jgi:putative nucleotidyltransferase with HDIG domain
VVYSFCPQARPQFPQIVDIPRSRDAHRLWITDATASRLPSHAAAHEGGSREEPKNGLHHVDLLLPRTLTASSKGKRRPGALQELGAAWRRIDQSVIYVLGLWALAGATSLGLVLSGYRVHGLAGIASLALVAAVAERGRVRITEDLEASISLVPTAVAAVLFGPVGAMLVGAASFAADLRPPYLRWAAITAHRTITGAGAGLAAVYAGSLIGNPIGAIAIATAAAALVGETIDVVFTAVTYRVRGRGAMAVVMRSLAPLALAAVPLYTPVVVLLALAYREVSAWALLFFFIPAVAAHRIFCMYQSQRGLVADLAVANAQLQSASLSFASALVVTLDARDRWTAGHSATVAIYARDIAKQLGLSEEDQELAYVCGLVHDIGKVGLPSSLLEKSGALTPEERRQMQSHAEIGEKILQNVTSYAEIARFVRHHHERWDGGGYPDHLAGAEIPLLSRIVGVADAYDAMTSDRPYRDAMSSRLARLQLGQAADIQFDPLVVAAFEAILAVASVEYLTGKGETFRLVGRDPWSTERAA